MSQTGLEPIDATVQKTHVWLNDLMNEMGWLHRHQAYHALRTVLHALRDRLSVDEAAALSAQLPTLIRGMFFEGWHPAGKPLREKRGSFLDQLAADYRDRFDGEPEEIARAVFRVLARHITPGEVEKVAHVFPTGVRNLWPVL
jgi:uncharacterized protein (DUF2267 family)